LKCCVGKGKSRSRSYSRSHAARAVARRPCRGDGVQDVLSGGGGTESVQLTGVATGTTGLGGGKQAISSSGAHGGTAIDTVVSSVRGRFRLD
jgi:hypothetical protein